MLGSGVCSDNKDLLNHLFMGNLTKQEEVLSDTNKYGLTMEHPWGDNRYQGHSTERPYTGEYVVLCQP